MQFSVFNDTDWLFPDSCHTDVTSIELDAPRGGHAGAQILGAQVNDAVSIQFHWDSGNGPAVELYQLLPVGVNENTAATLMTTTDYESCKDFVTRQAPFYVYDALMPVEEGIRNQHRLAFYMTVEPSQQDLPGRYTGSIAISIGTDTTRIPVSCTVHHAAVPPLSQSRLGMLNFFDYDGLAVQHGVEKYSHAYWTLFAAYVKAQISLHCTHILLPAGEAVFAEGKLVGFDFSAAEKAGQIAIEAGALHLCGGHIAHWHEWDEGEYYPNWDQKTGITTQDGYFQMRLYFTQWAEVVRRNGWQDCMTQALADEPQTHNDKTYRILAAMFRKFFPNTPIIDAVETTNLGGAIDIWVPKQDTYEKWRDEYERLKAAGEEMWFYTCAFPAGPAMNRSMDLPLSISRTVLWMGALYRLSGFLHWGFNYYIGDDIWNRACCPHKGALLPAGDAHIVYPGTTGPWRSMRFEAQRGGAEDYDLLVQAIERDPAFADRLIQTVCTTFRDYSRSGAEVLNARRMLLEFLDQPL